MLNWGNITFENPQWFWLFALIPFMVAWYIWKRDKQTAEVTISSIKGFKVKQGLLPKLRPVLFVLRLLALALLITAMARPRTVDVSSRTKSNKGIDIMMAIDVSASMLARDLKPDRLIALKKVAAEFIKGRPNDRIGLVVYAGESYTKTPITSDKRIVLSALKDVKENDILKSGTAIGMGLATAVNRLKDSKADSKVIILMTDGVNNSGFIDPKIATEMAEKYNMKTYTIGIGTNGMAMTPVAILPDGSYRYARSPVEIDEGLLKEIAKKTGGKYFRATDNQKLKEIYKEINKLEKTDIEEFKYYNYDEKYRSLLMLAGVLFLLEILLRFSLFRSFV